MSFLDPRVWLALAMVFVLASAAGYWRGDVAGYKSGHADDHADWVEADAKRVKAEGEAVAKREKSNEAKRLADNAQNLTDAQHHEEHDKAVSAENTRLRADVRHAGGLRVPAPDCEGFAGPPQTPSDGRPVAPAAGTVALPDQIAEDLLSTAAEADAVVEQARAMQVRLLEDDKPDPARE